MPCALTRVRRAMLAISLVAGVAACGSDAASGPGTQPPPDDPGQLVATDFMPRGLSYFGEPFHTMVWSSSGDALFFLTSAQDGPTITNTLRSVPAVGGTVSAHRTVPRELQTLQWADAVGAIYSTTNSAFASDIVRAPLDGTPEVALLSRVSNDFKVSADGTRLFYRTSPAAGQPYDSLRVLDRTTGARWALALAAPLVVSPSRDEVLVQRYAPGGNDFTYEIVSLLGGASRIVHTEPTSAAPISDRRLVDGRWSADGLHLLISSPIDITTTTPRLRYVDRIAVTGQETLIADIDMWGPRQLWWSVDRREIGYWVEGECYRAGGGVSASCALLRHEFWIAQAGKAPVLAFTLNAEGEWPVALLSPDDGRVAYFVGESLYIKDLP